MTHCNDIIIYKKTYYGLQYNTRITDLGYGKKVIVMIQGRDLMGPGMDLVRNPDRAKAVILYSIQLQGSLADHYSPADT